MVGIDVEIHHNPTYKIWAWKFLQLGPILMQSKHNNHDEIVSLTYCALLALSTIKDSPHQGQ